MPRDPRYDILFEPVKIGPKIARNRFYQVPHCNGMGHQHPSSLAAMRGVKAEGGWAVVSTEEVELHYSSDLSPFNEGRLWDDADIPYHSRVVEKIHEHGSLAAIELVYSSFHGINNYSREAPLSAICRPNDSYDPTYSHAMNKADIKAFRQWHRDAALRAKRCGYDLIYVYCGHNMTLQSHFLSRRYNDRIDEYGGSLENRVRLLRETLQDTLEAVGDSCAVPIRFAVDELMGSEGLSCENEARDVVEMLAEMPDLWDVNISNWDNDSQTSRFAESGYQEPFISFVKKITNKPVVGVGRYTSPDAMVSLINNGVMDMIGAARPSIADPFLPKKIEEGRIEDIRECIGCNMCVVGDHQAVPMRCTQNPTMGEEWRRDWHPEKIAKKASDSRILIVGAGPTGMEAAMALGQRGYEVMLAEATKALGGRVRHESGLPGLRQWGRVRDYREYQIRQLSNVEIYLDNQLTADDILSLEASHVAIATGSPWRRDGRGREHHDVIPGLANSAIYTPDDIMQGTTLSGDVVVYDDEHFYMGGVLAEKLCQHGAKVTLVTPATDVSTFTHNSLEQHRIQKQLMEMGVTIITSHRFASVTKDSVTIACTYTSREQQIAAQSIVLVTAMLPETAVFDALQSQSEQWADTGIKAVDCIGDAYAPGTIAAAVWSGHRYAREMDTQSDSGVPFKRELIRLSSN